MATPEAQAIVDTINGLAKNAVVDQAKIDNVAAKLQAQIDDLSEQIKIERQAHSDDLEAIRAAAAGVVDQVAKAS